MGKPESLRLGKREYEHDERTLRIGELLAPAVFTIPHTWDFDLGRFTLPLGLWGNDKWQNSVIVARGNHLLRSERAATKVTLPLVEEQIIAKYKELSGAQEPGDEHDQGLGMLTAMRDWRRGWQLGRHTHTLAAYGELSSDPFELRVASFLLNGIQLGLALPMTALQQWQSDLAWDDTGHEDKDAEPGSWGLHTVYAKHFDEHGIFAVTWGCEQYMTNRFLVRYCDERWAVIDDVARHVHYLDVDRLLDYLRKLDAQSFHQ